MLAGHLCFTQPAWQAVQGVRGLRAGKAAHFQRCRPRTRRAAGGQHRTPPHCLWPRWPQRQRPWRPAPRSAQGGWGRLEGRRAGRRKKQAHHARSKKVSHRGGPRYSPTSTEGTCTTADPAKNRPAQADGVHTVPRLNWNLRPVIQRSVTAERVAVSYVGLANLRQGHTGSWSSASPLSERWPQMTASSCQSKSTT